MEEKDWINDIDMNDQLMTVPEVAKFLRSNKNTVYRLIKAGLLMSIRVGSTKVLRSTLLKMIKKYENCDITDPENIVFIGTDV